MTVADAGGRWWCEAYGPPPAGMGDLPSVWPRCFLQTGAGTDRLCGSQTVCAETMDAERHRVYALIQEGAAAGDETMLALAAEFTSPGMLLNGPDMPGCGE